MTASKPRTYWSVSRATDPPTIAAVAIVLVAVALLACYLPGRRASRQDSLAALRAE